jgi:hypothetical protein
MSMMSKYYPTTSTQAAQDTTFDIPLMDVTLPSFDHLSTDELLTAINRAERGSAYRRMAMQELKNREARS